MGTALFVPWQQGTPLFGGQYGVLQFDYAHLTTGAFLAAMLAITIGAPTFP